MVGKLNLAFAKMFPISVIDRSGDVIVDTPPSLSDSAKLKHILSSCSAFPPITEPIKTPSGTSDSLNPFNVLCRSFTQWRLILLTIKSS